MSDFVTRLGDALVAAAERQARRRAWWRRPLGWPRRGSTRALVLVGALALVGAGGTVGLLAARGHVGGPPTLTFARITPQQRAAGIRALTRPVVFARGRLPDDGRAWQLVGFQTSRGFCVDVDWPEQHLAGGCGLNIPQQRRALIDWQAQIPLRSAKQAVIVGAVDPSVAAVRVDAIRSVRTPRIVGRTQLVRVEDPRLLAAMGLTRPFAYYVAELPGSLFDVHGEALDAAGRVRAHIAIPDDMTDTPGGGFAVRGRGCETPSAAQPAPRMVSTLPPSSIRAQLAPLRRAQRPGDRLPASLANLFKTDPEFASVEVGAIRRPGLAADGSRIYLVPTVGRAAPPIAAGCLRTLTPRGRVIEARRHRIAARFATRLSVRGYLAGRNGAGAGGPSFDPARIRAGKPTYSLWGHDVLGIVPDDVSSVELRFADGTRRTAVPHQNVWSVLVPTNAGRTRLDLEIWRDRSGRTIRRARY